MFDVNLNLDQEGTSLEVHLDVTLMKQIIELVERLEKYYGRELNDVRVVRDPDNTQRVIIDIHKHGETEYQLNEFGLIDWEEVRKG